MVSTSAIAAVVAGPVRPLRRIALPVRPPYSIQFEITYRCNLHCSMCYNGSGPARAGELRDEQWIGLTQQAIDLGILEAIISGGEPLLRGAALVTQMIRLLSDAGVSIHLITNGTFVTREFVRGLRGLNMRLCQTSIDGPCAEIHDAIRGRNNFDEVTRATQLFTSHGFNSRIGSTIQRRNEAHIQDLIELAIFLGSHEIVIDEFLPVGRAIAHYRELLPTRTHEEIVKEVRHYRKAYENLILVREGMGCREQLRQQASPEINDSIIIRPNGDLRLGCMAPFTSGNACELGLERAWSEGGAYAWRSEKVQSYIERVVDNPSLHQQQIALGIVHGFENARL